MEVKGTRKAKANRETQLMLLTGFALAVWCKADAQLFIAFGVAMTGASAAFMWGNAKVAQTQAKAAALDSEAKP